MAVTGAGYRALAEICLKDADAAALEQVRERCLRSAAALIAMAEANERVEAARAAPCRAFGLTNCRLALQPVKPVMSQVLDSPMVRRLARNLHPGIGRKRREYMRLAILAAGLMAAMPAMPASAVTTVLDFSGNICGVAGDQACSNASSIGQTYGSTADVSVLWRGRTGPGNTSVSTPYVLFWSDAYADLLGVAYAGTTGEATFTVAPGKTLSLDSVDVGGWPFANRFSGVRVYDLDWNLVFDTDAIVFPGTTAATIAIGKSSTAGLIFQWGPDAFNGGIDNLTFTVRDSGPVIPEPGTWAMMIAGFGLVGAAARRRKIATA